MNIYNRIQGRICKGGKNIMEKLKVEIMEGFLVGDDNDLDVKINNFCDKNEVVDVELMQSWNRDYYIATIKYIEKE